ncbi:MAG: DUF3450 family protein [Gammaproteobacteria bacterium]|nr:DUF3450 family protein [Gammaproteobacteria bacterium]
MTHWRFALLLLAWPALALAQSPTAVIDDIATLQSQALAAQKRIDALYAEAAQFRQQRAIIAAEGSADALLIRELETQANDRRQHLDRLRADLAAVAETELGIVALMASMQQALAAFVSLDLPFATTRRQQRIRQLGESLVQREQSVTARYQSIIQGYLDEIGYGQTDEVTVMQVAAGDRTVPVLRLGRAGLWYVTPDGQHAGRYDPLLRQWTAGGDNRAIAQAQQVVTGRIPPRAVTLPVRTTTP